MVKACTGAAAPHTARGTPAGGRGSQAAPSGHNSQKRLIKRFVGRFTRAKFMVAVLCKGLVEKATLALVGKPYAPMAASVSDP
jgi:hypothetical protein